jgi:hypothetical protein
VWPSDKVCLLCTTFTPLHAFFQGSMACIAQLLALCLRTCPWAIRDFVLEIGIYIYARVRHLLDHHTHTHSHCIACALEVVSAIPSILCTARVQCAEKMWWLPITHAGGVMFHDRGTVGCNACWCDMTRCNPMLLRRRRHN